MFKNFKNGFIKENPVFGLYLGMCSTLALSKSVNTAIAMAACVTIVLVFSNMIISAMRKIIPDEIRIPVYIVVIATLVTVVQMVLNAYAPSLYKSLGAYLSLVVVNCIILGRAEAFANKNDVLPSMVDGLSMGLGYAFSIISIALVREFLANGGIDLFGLDLTIAALKPYAISLFSDSVGAFLTFGCFAALFTVLRRPKAEKKEAK